MEKEEVALKKERSEMPLAHREVFFQCIRIWLMRYTRRVQVPADEHAREKSSCATDAAATAVQAATHAPITDGTHVHARRHTRALCGD